jgi:hypothetical protein
VFPSGLRACRRVPRQARSHSLTHDLMLASTCVRGRPWPSLHFCVSGQSDSTASSSVDTPRSIAVNRTRSPHQDVYILHANSRKSQRGGCGTRFLSLHWEPGRRTGVAASWPRCPGHGYGPGRPTSGWRPRTAHWTRTGRANGKWWIGGYRAVPLT